MLWVGLCRLYCGAAKRQQKNRTKCVRLIMGTQISGKIAWKKNRPKIRSADPESIARIRKFKLLILTQLRVLYPPRSADFFFFVLCPWSEVQSVIIRPNSATRFVPPKIGWDPSQPQDIGWYFFFVLSQGARFAHRSSDHEPSPQHWTHRQYGMFTATLLR